MRISINHLPLDRSPRSTFYTWIKPYKVVRTGSGTEVSTVDYMGQKKHVEKLENMIDVLRTVGCNIESPLKVKLEELTKFMENIASMSCANL